MVEKKQFTSLIIFDYDIIKYQKEYQMHSSTDKGYPIVVNEKSWNKHLSTHQIISIVNRCRENKGKILKQLQQLQMNTDQLANLQLNELYKEVQPIFKNTYSIKYLGLSNNEMGIVSKRVDPLKPTLNNENYTVGYTINKYFYPKPLKVVKKPEENEKINILTLEQEIRAAFENSTYKNRCKQKIKKTSLHGSWLKNIKTTNEKPEEFKQNLKTTFPNFPQIKPNFSSSISRKFYQPEFGTRY